MTYSLLPGTGQAYGRRLVLEQRQREVGRVMDAVLGG